PLSVRGVGRESSRSVSLSRCCPVTVSPVANLGVEHYNRFTKSATYSLACVACFRADFAFAAIQKPRDVCTVHEPHENGKQEKKRRDTRQADVPDGKWSKRAREERGERPIAGGHR